MKRHDSLAPLSREHHAALILARLLQKGAPVFKGLPADIAGKAAYARQFYRDELIPHFMAEENMVLLNIKGTSHQLDTLAEDIIREHKLLKLLFEMMPGADHLEDHLDSLGFALEKHIRKEERELFPLIQSTCSESILDAIKRSFAA